MAQRTKSSVNIAGFKDPDWAYMAMAIDSGLGSMDRAQRQVDLTGVCWPSRQDGPPAQLDGIRERQEDLKGVDEVALRMNERPPLPANGHRIMYD
jgi:hypothetical protein